jgi:phosphopantetheinyl transferase
MTFSREELDDMAILLGVQSLELYLKPEWGAHADGHREKIRLDLSERAYGKDDFTDTSVSHAQDLGGYAMIHHSKGETTTVGFDLEVVTRVKPEVAARVCEDPAEFAAAPSPAALWCAKEAGFKALKGPDQPPVLPYLVVHSWKRKSQYETFEISLRQKDSGLKAWGLTFEKDVYQFAIVCRTR